MTVENLPNAWRGQTVACIASGPSLVRADCDAVRGAGLRTIVCNASFRAAPWADILLGMDLRFWQAYADEIVATFPGRRIGCGARIEHLGIGGETIRPMHMWLPKQRNTGANAIALAVAMGAARVLLLGYDAQPGADGRAHWHADHPAPLHNATSMPAWPKHFANVAEFARRKGAAVINCSRATALACFPRRPLAAELEQLREALAA